MHRVLVVGAGATGASACWRLRQLLPEMQLEVWEKARGPGLDDGLLRRKKTETDMWASAGKLETAFCWWLHGYTALLVLRGCDFATNGSGI